MRGAIWQRRHRLKKRIFGLIDSEAFWATDFQNNLGPWLGGDYYGDLANIATTDWKWVTGEGWGYTNWETASNEPNGNPGEFYINYFNYGSQTIRDSTWNNMVNIYPETEISGNTEVRGYIIEWTQIPYRSLLPSGCLFPACLVFSLPAEKPEVVKEGCYQKPDCHVGRDDPDTLANGSGYA